MTRAAALTIALLVARAAAAQDTHPAHRVPSIPHELLERPIAIRTGVGSVHHAVSTASREAQALYDQGLAFLHSYAWIDAARSFNEALRLDAKLAMSHVGLSEIGRAHV